jgi:ribosomal protein L40E
MLVALFGLSIFAQEIMGQSPLSIAAETLPDFAFIAGAVLAVLAFIARPRAAKKQVSGTKFCIKCGASLPLDAVYCQKCGSKQA